MPPTHLSVYIEELAGILHALGSETHLHFRGETVLRRGFDPFIVEASLETCCVHWLCDNADTLNTVVMS
eukprot:6177827-Amphidinium_carterae.2